MKKKFLFAMLSMLLLGGLSVSTSMATDMTVDGALNVYGIAQIGQVNTPSVATTFRASTNNVAFFRSEAGSNDAWMWLENAGSSASNSVGFGSNNNDFIFRAGGTERARLTGTGRFGVGVKSPIAGFHSKATGTPWATLFETNLTEGWLLLNNTATVNYHSVGLGAVGDDLALRAGDLVRMRVTGTGNVGIGTNTPSTLLDVNGEATVDVLNIRGADLSERFNIAEKNGAVKPGVVVCINPDEPGKLMLSSTPYDRKVAGIVSGAGDVATGLVMNEEGTIDGGTHAVALSGRVYCMATAANGSIEPGDLLTTSAIPGHAMKVDDYSKSSGAIIGKAMSRLQTGDGMVLVLVNLH